jgi:hypothetical protein
MEKSRIRDKHPGSATLGSRIRNTGRIFNTGTQSSTIDPCQGMILNHFLTAGGVPTKTWAAAGGQISYRIKKGGELAIAYGIPCLAGSAANARA